MQGVLECGGLLVAALCEGREQYIFGRRTLPEMDLASVSCAIQNLWLAARAEGIGMGWVSLFDPLALAQLLHMPEGSLPIAVLCLGHVEAFYPGPMLELTGWAKVRPLSELMFVDRWNNGATDSYDIFACRPSHWRCLLSPRARPFPTVRRDWRNPPTDAWKQS